MKRFLVYCLVAVTLGLGVTLPAFGGAQAGFGKAGSPLSQNSSADPNKSSFHASPVFDYLGPGSEQIRLVNSFQQVAFRLLPSLSNAFRISYQTQLTHQQFATGYVAFLLKSAFKQSDGYYLYHLRKLLI